MDFRELLNAPGPVLLDGGMGTMLQARGLKLGEYPELAALEHPDWLLDIHRAYVAAAARSCAPTPSGPTGRSCAATGRTVEEVIPPSIALARQAAGGRALVALDLGPIGQLLEPTGSLDFETAVDIFARRCAPPGRRADLVMVETMTDLQECRAALLRRRRTAICP